MLIRNYHDLATDKLRQDGLTILNAGLMAVAPDRVVGKLVRVEGQRLMIGETAVADLTEYKRIFMVGAGKVAHAVAVALEPVLAPRLAGGVVVGTWQGQTEKIEYVEADHPLPSLKNVEASKRLVEMVEGAGGDDLVVAIITGGGSSMLCLPHVMSVEAQARLIDALMKAGADIFEVNTVRKHTSQVKGGWLASKGKKTNMVALIFSDVIGDDLSMVASGPTVADQTTVADAQLILKKYNLWEECTRQGCKLIETPKDEAVFERVKNILVVSNRLALEAMGNKAQELGYSTQVLQTAVSGEARLVGRELLGRLNQPGQAVIAGGETTVHVTGTGQGGRNQELVLGCLAALGDNQVIISCASDGVDNKTKFAGAIGDKKTLDEATKKILNPEIFLDNNDATNFFEQEGDGIETGPLPSNVADLMIAINGKV